jgi:hypothetical protein
MQSVSDRRNLRAVSSVVERPVYDSRSRFRNPHTAHVCRWLRPPNSRSEVFSWQITSLGVQNPFPGGALIDPSPNQL